MLVLFLICVFVLVMNIGLCIAHVFCQDAHATDWTPLGYSCPITCAAVVAAARRMRETDYEDFVLQSPFSLAIQNNISSYEYDSESLELPNEEDARVSEREEDNWIRSRPDRHRYDLNTRHLTLSHFVELYKTLQDTQYAKEFQMPFMRAAKHLDYKPCDMFKRGKIMKHLLHAKCSDRPSVRRELVREVTEILNRHAGADFFSYRLTGKILEYILQEEDDVHLGRLNMAKLQKRLRDVVVDKTPTRVAGRIVTLKSKYCLNVHVPGCFCIPGYVEQNGQCVRPPDCFPTDEDIEYVSRIHVT